MALATINGFSVEEATSGYVYENLLPAIQHINGKGVIDKYTLSEDVRSINKIDVMRLKQVFPAVRKLGATNNGGYMNKFNVPGSGNSPQSVSYSIGVDLFYDRAIPVPAAQLLANRTNFEQICQAEVVDTMAWAINIVTYAKQLEGFFRNGDNFDKAKTHSVGSVVAGDITAAEIAASVFTYSAADANGAPKAFIKANAALTKGVPQIGAMVVPAGARQAFITSDFNADMKSQYSSNASEAAAQINATGYMNPFTQTESVRINESTGLCGMYDGVGLYLLNESTKAIVYIYLGVAGTSNDADSTLAACRASLDKIAGFIVYGAGTCRGIAVAPTITVSPEPYNAQMVVIAPLMKMGVDVLHGASIKVITNAALTATEIAALVNKVKFTPIDDDGTLALAALPDYDFNDGTTK